MKSLVEYINEVSVLDMEGTLSKTEKDIYPAPEKKDFYKLLGGKCGIDWYCPHIVRSCANNIKCLYKNLIELEKNVVDKSTLDTITASVYKSFVTLNLNSSNKPANYIFLQGIKIKGKSSADAKNIILKIFKMIEANPDNLNILIDCHNEACNHINKGFGGAWNDIPEEYKIDINDILTKFK